MNSSPFFIINPTSGGGRSKSLWQELQPLLKETFGKFDFVFTRSAKDGPHQASLAIKKGFRWLIAAGGDGTLHDVINGAIEGLENVSRLSEITVGLLPMGSGDDFKRTIGWSADARVAIEKLKNRHTQKIDLGKMTYLSNEGHEKSLYFINIADFGLGGKVMREVNRSKKFFGPKLTYLYQELKTLLTYKPCSVVIETPKKNYHFHEVLLGIVANGRYFGSGLCIAPQAKIEDGLFEVVMIEKTSFLTALRRMPDLYLGRPFEEKSITRFQASRLTVQPTSLEPIWIEVDGEQPGKLPATFEVLPGALNLCV